MREEKKNSIFVSYVKQYRLTVLMFLLFSTVFGIVFYLYKVEIEAVSYASGLCSLLAGTILTVHFIGYVKRTRLRRRTAENLPLLLDELPTPQTLAEEEYQEMLRAMKRMYDEDRTRWQNERRESVDYYTAWVHQIKTPISVMRMALQEEDTAENRALLAELFRIEQYVEMVLSYLRLASVSSDFVFQKYNLDSILRQAIHKYAPLFVRRRIRLCYEPVEMEVLTDEKWLLFILEQILSNAVKYTPEGGTVTIEVMANRVLRITDTGIGIAPEDVPRIFEKGFTGYNGRMDKKSTGLGLYLSRLAAEKLSHRIWAKSEVGEGTTIYIDLYTKGLETD